MSQLLQTISDRSRE